MDPNRTDDDARRAPEVPVAPDRPVVDGRAMSAAELRAEIEELDDEQVAHVEELREEVADTVDELAARLDVRARWRAGRQEAVERLPAPGVLLAGAGAVLVLLVVARRRRSASRRAARAEG